MSNCSTSGFRRWLEGRIDNGDTIGNLVAFAFENGGRVVLVRISRVLPVIPDR